MADDQPLSPLDDAFVASLIQRVGVDDRLLGAAAQRHWKAVIARFPVAQHIAQRFACGEWVGDEDWFVDPGIQEVFRGYDWMRYAGQTRPTGPQTAQDTPSTQVLNAPRGQDSQMRQARQTSQMGLSSQTGRQPARNIPPTPVPNPPQSQTIPTAPQTVQNTSSAQAPSTRGQDSRTGQTSQAGRQPVRNTPPTQAPNTPQSPNARMGRRTTQNSPTTQVPDTPRGQDSHTGRQNVQNTPRTQGRTRLAAGGLTPGPDVADDDGPPRGRQPQATGNVRADTQRTHTGQQPQDAGTAPGGPTTGAAALLGGFLGYPQHQQRPPATRPPSPPYDDRLDLDSEPEQGAQAHPEQAAPADAHDGSIPPPMQPSPQDMERSHNWKGQRLPALGVRLTHLMNFLCDEDVDRDISWREHVDEAEQYLRHIRSDREFWHIGRETRDMVDRLLEMVEAHRIFEKYHYGTFNSTKIITPDLVNKPALRLNYDHDNPIVLRGKGRPGASKWHDIMPGDFPDQPRRQGLVNNMWLTGREHRAGLTDELRARHQMALARAEDAWWGLEADETPPGDNLSVMENKMYEDIVAADFGLGFDGWVNIEPVPGGGGPDAITRWCAGPTMLSDCAGSFARERGARRAGLQGALRQFRNMENQLACTPWRRLVLAPSAEELRLARRDAGAGYGRKWPLKALEHDKMRKTEGKDDPQGFTVAMAQFWRDQLVYMRQAREGLIGEFGGRGPHAPLGEAPHPQWVTPPKSIWGPYIWRAVDPDTENHQDMLKQMRAAKKLFDRELRVAPRQLLTDMDELYKKGYANQGLSQGSVVFQDPQTKADVVVDLHPRRDFTGGDLSDLDKMEMYWIRFILNNSITTQMTQQIEPRTSLYIVFAERLSRIFNDISDPLFPCNGTKVSVEDLLEYMHKKTDGPVKTVKFYAHDAQRWLERLAVQGRCRYEVDWRCYGWVQRPVPDCHPENLINWQVTDEDQDIAPNMHPEDMVFAPRISDLRPWGDVIDGGKPPNFLCENVTNYFQCLAYRWGQYMHKLENPENGLEKGWKTKAAVPHEHMHLVIDGIESEYRHLVNWDQKDNNWDNNPLVSLVKRTLPEKKDDASVSPGASIQIIRDHIINEAMRNDTMLWPARNANSYTDDHDEKVRPPLWDWAKVEVRGPVKKFFNVNRWPLQMQTEDTQRQIKSDKDLSVQQLWNPVTEDPTPWMFYRPKARPYVDEKVKFRSGHRIYPIGDTPRQKKVVENQMYATLGRAMGLPDTDQRRPGLVSRLSSFFRRGGHDDDDDDFDRPGSRLPRVDPRDIPKSYDPRAEADRKRKAVDDARNGSTKAVRLTRAELPDDAVEVGDLDATFDLDNDPRFPELTIGANFPLGPRH